MPRHPVQLQPAGQAPNGEPAGFSRQGRLLPGHRPRPVTLPASGSPGSGRPRVHAPAAPGGGRRKERGEGEGERGAFGPQLTPSHPARARPRPGRGCAPSPEPLRRLWHRTTALRERHPGDPRHFERLLAWGRHPCHYSRALPLPESCSGPAGCRIHCLPLLGGNPCRAVRTSRTPPGRPAPAPHRASNFPSGQLCSQLPCGTPPPFTGRVPARCRNPAGRHATRATNSLDGYVCWPSRGGSPCPRQQAAGSRQQGQQGQQAASPLRLSGSAPPRAGDRASAPPRSRPGPARRLRPAPPRPGRHGLRPHPDHPGGVSIRSTAVTDPRDRTRPADRADHVPAGEAARTTRPAAAHARIRT